MTRTAKTTVTYANAWKDQLTGYSDVEISYDAIGNPDKTVNADGDVLLLEWEGRRLTNVDDVEYTYNEDGLRTAKTVGDTTTHYYWSGGTLIGQKTGGDVMKFSDMGFVLNGVAYFYVKNLQGDVVKVVNNAGAVVASYSYDAWGSVISSSGDLAEVNPIRYRGYYFDVESGLYYLQSRYYNPNWGRFINADTVFAQLDVTDNNLYAYCGNDPIGYLDSEGMYRIREDRKRTVIIDKANEAYEAINWYEENRERYPIYIADYYYRDYQDGMAMAVFEIAAERAKTEYTFGIASQGYGIVQVAGEYTIISTSTEVMVISWGVAEVAIADFGKAVYSLAKDASTSFWTIFGGLIGGAILTGMNDDEGDNSALQMSDGALVGRMSLYDELNQIFKDIKNNSSYDELIIWLNYDAIYGKDKSHHFGKNLTAFWKYIFG